MLVPVAHFQREPYSTFGNPFLIKIKEGETYEEIKERIRAHIDVPEKDFEKYRYLGLWLLNAGNFQWILQLVIGSPLMSWIN